jgi:hypothetical protein
MVGYVLTHTDLIQLLFGTQNDIIRIQSHYTMQDAWGEVHYINIAFCFAWDLHFVWAVRNFPVQNLLSYSLIPQKYRR